MILEHKTFDLFGKMLFEKAILDAPGNRPIPMPDEACFLYILNGNYHGKSEMETIEVPAKDAVLMKCGNYVGRMIPNAQNEQYEALAVHFYPEVLKKIYANEIPDFLKNPLPQTVKGGMTRLKSSVLLEKYIDSLLFYFENPEMVTEELLVLKVKELMLLLMNTPNAPAVYEILSNLFSPETHSFKEVVEAHIFTDISVPELAALTYQSLSSFKRTFKKTYNASPASYIKVRKIQKAAELLLVSDTPVSHIAYDCGFSDIAHFSRSFKSHFGVSPSQYRAGRWGGMIGK